MKFISRILFWIFGISTLIIVLVMLITFVFLFVEYKKNIQEDMNINLTRDKEKMDLIHSNIESNFRIFEKDDNVSNFITRYKDDFYKNAPGTFDLDKQKAQNVLDNIKMTLNSSVSNILSLYFYLKDKDGNYKLMLLAGQREDNIKNDIVNRDKQKFDIANDNKSNIFIYFPTLVYDQKYGEIVSFGKRTVSKNGNSNSGYLFLYTKADILYSEKNGDFRRHFIITSKGFVLNYVKKNKRILSTNETNIREYILKKIAKFNLKKPHIKKFLKFILNVFGIRTKETQSSNPIYEEDCNCVFIEKYPKALKSEIANINQHTSWLRLYPILKKISNKRSERNYSYSLKNILVRYIYYMLSDIISFFGEYNDENYDGGIGLSKNSNYYINILYYKNFDIFLIFTFPKTIFDRYISLLVFIFFISFSIYFFVSLTIVIRFFFTFSNSIESIQTYVYDISLGYIDKKYTYKGKKDEIYDIFESIKLLSSTLEYNLRNIQDSTEELKDILSTFYKSQSSNQKIDEEKIELDKERINSYLDNIEKGVKNLRSISDEED